MIVAQLVSRAVTFETKDPRFESSHRQNLNVLFI